MLIPAAHHQSTQRPTIRYSVHRLKARQAQESCGLRRAADATDATADLTAPAVTFLLAAADLTAGATAPLVTFLVAFVVGVAVCAKATVDPATIERIY